MKVCFCIPTVTRPYKVTLDSLSASIPLIEAAGWDHAMVAEIGCPYISGARATMLRKALDDGADVVVFIDHDLSWNAGDMLKLINTPGDVVAGLYRFKTDGDPHYMGVIDNKEDGTPTVRKDGCIKATRVPAGFLKVTKEAVGRFMVAYPHLVYGPAYNPSVDLFNHGAHKGAWWGEDYAFSRNWIDAGGEIWVVPDIDLNHHTDSECFAGNFHKFMLAQPGGSEAPK